MATVELRFTAVPAHVRTARLVVVSLGRRLGLDEELLDEVRLAVGEAAARAVRRHQASCPTAAVLVRMTAADDRFVVEVGDIDTLKTCISSLRQVESVFDAYRVTPGS